MPGVAGGTTAKRGIKAVKMGETLARVAWYWQNRALDCAICGRSCHTGLTVNDGEYIAAHKTCVKG